jgi:chromate transporter
MNECERQIHFTGEWRAGIVKICFRFAGLIFNATIVNTVKIATNSVSDANVTAYGLFWAFSRIALSGFGGVLPFAYRGLVEKQGWLSPAEFAEFLGLSQMLPGPTICNIALMVGHKYGGTRGALAALAGMIAFPFLLVIALGAMYQRFGDLAAVRDALRGMAAVAAGLILATAIKMAIAMYRKKDPAEKRAVQTGLWLLAFIGLGLLGWRLIWVFGPLAAGGTFYFYVMRDKK